MLTNLRNRPNGQLVLVHAVTAMQRGLVLHGQIGFGEVHGHREVQLSPEVENVLNEFSKMCAKPSADEIQEGVVLPEKNSMEMDLA